MFSSLYLPKPPLTGRLQLPQVCPLAPSSSSSASDETCLKNAPSCGTSSQWGKRIPSLQGHLCPASVSKNENQSNKNPHSNSASYIKLQNTHCSKILPSWHTDLHSSSCKKCISPAGSNDPPPAVDMIHLLCRDPGPGLVIWRDGNSILPACRVQTLVIIPTNTVYSSRWDECLHLDRPQLCWCPQSTHPPTPNLGDNRTLQGCGSFLHSGKNKTSFIYNQLWHHGLLSIWRKCLLHVSTLRSPHRWRAQQQPSNLHQGSESRSGTPHPWIQCVQHLPLSTSWNPKSHTPRAHQCVKEGEPNVWN